MLHRTCQLGGSLSRIGNKTVESAAPFMSATKPAVNDAQRETIRDRGLLTVMMLLYSSLCIELTTHAAIRVMH